MPLQGKTVFVFAEDLYEEMELWVPVYRLREAGATCVIIGSGSAQTYKGKKGFYPVTVDGDAKDFSGEDCDALLIPGGYAPDKMRRYPDMIRIVREANAKGTPIASICHGPWMFCSADIVRGRKVTSSPAIRVDLENAGATWVNQDVCVNQNLITSRSPDDLPAFNKAILAALHI